MNVPPETFVNASRFDILAKLLYARYRNRDSYTGWVSDLYDAHIMAFNGGWEYPGDSKTKIEQFRPSFDALLDSVRDSDASNRVPVPVGKNGIPLNGSHRIAACTEYGVQLSVEYLSRDGMPYSYLFFKNYKMHVNVGLVPKYTDPMAMEYVRRKGNSRLVVLFPSVVDHHDEIVCNIGVPIVYAKDIHVSHTVLSRLMTQFYRGEKWIGSRKNGYYGACVKAKLCIAGAEKSVCRVLLIDETDSKCIQLKQSIRESHKQLEKHSVHINDTHEETRRLASVLFNSNSMHFVRHSQWNHHHYDVLQQLESYPRSDRRCVDSSAVMALYGIRTAGDVDYVSDLESVDLASFDNHNEHARNFYKQAGYHINDLIYDPNCHFYHDGIRFATLDVVRGMKEQRIKSTNEKKDVRDVDAILASP